SARFGKRDDTVHTGGMESGSPASAAGPTSLATPHPATAGAAVEPAVHVDPGCGMTIGEGDAVGAYEYNGVTYYFCAESCLDRFRASPDAFLTGTAQSGPAPSGTTFVCPMDPEVRQNGPGACPKCGMALEPDLSTLPTARVEYTCPMHPEI